MCYMTWTKILYSRRRKNDFMKAILGLLTKTEVQMPEQIKSMISMLNVLKLITILWFANRIFLTIGNTPWSIKIWCKRIMMYATFPQMAPEKMGQGRETANKRKQMEQHGKNKCIWIKEQGHSLHYSYSCISSVNLKWIQKTVWKLKNGLEDKIYCI